MLSFNNLGKLGRLGNQMFQYAALLCIAKRTGYEFCIPRLNGKDEYGGDQLSAAFNLPSLKIIGWLKTLKMVQPSTFAYDAQLAEHCENNVDLFGYFQTERYFSDQAELVRKEFVFAEPVKSYCSEFLRRLGGAAVSLHVRRTDYLTNSANHPPCDLEYYERALAILPLNLPIIILSDDIPWCKQQPLFKGPRWFFGEGKSNVVDMCLMSMCSHHIIANSSFSWWGAWLGANRDKKVLAPIKWFGDGYTAAHDTRDLIPAVWTKV
jgi:hypothetical protein